MLALMVNQILEQHQLFQPLHQLNPVASKDQVVLSFLAVVDQAAAEPAVADQAVAEPAAVVEVQLDQPHLPDHMNQLARLIPVRGLVVMYHLDIAKLKEIPTITHLMPHILTLWEHVNIYWLALDTMPVYALKVLHHLTFECNIDRPGRREPMWQ